MMLQGIIGDWRARSRSSGPAQLAQQLAHLRQVDLFAVADLTVLGDFVQHGRQHARVDGVALLGGEAGGEAAGERQLVRRHAAVEHRRLQVAEVRVGRTDLPDRLVAPQVGGRGGGHPQKGGKVVQAWAFEGDCDPGRCVSNTFRMEYPPGSGSFQEFPEVDRAEFFPIAEAKAKINPAQVQLLERLEATLHGSSG